MLRQAIFRSTRCSFASGNPRVAIVGSNQAAFYSARYLLENAPEVKVDMFEKYPVPFGLVRFGVAPDHPDVKNVIHSFTQTAKLPNFRFLGGVTVGSTVSVPELLNLYYAVILAYGASKDKKLKIPGEDGPGVISAKDFVGWYNGLPDNTDLNPDLSAETAVIFGQGNVALDCARILLTKPEDLAETDITSFALNSLKRSQIRNVYIVGRRGPMQVAFTIKEFRELTKLPGVNIILSDADVADVKASLDQFSRPRKRLTELIASTAGMTPEPSAKNLYFRFLLSPKRIIRTDSRSRVVGVNFKINKLEDPRNPESAVTTTEDIEAIKCGLVIRSVGYEAVPIDPVLPYDSEKHIIPNTFGRVDGIGGLYCSGWIKRGPVGVILTTMNDAYETVDTMLADLKKSQIRNVYIVGRRGPMQVCMSARTYHTKAYFADFRSQRRKAVEKAEFPIPGGLEAVKLDLICLSLRRIVEHIHSYPAIQKAIKQIRDSGRHPSRSRSPSGKKKPQLWVFHTILALYYIAPEIFKEFDLLYPGENKSYEEIANCVADEIDSVNIWLHTPRPTLPMLFASSRRFAVEASGVLANACSVLNDRYSGTSHPILVNLKQMDLNGGLKGWRLYLVIAVASGCGAWLSRLLADKFAEQNVSDCRCKNTGPSQNDSR